MTEEPAAFMSDAMIQAASTFNLASGFSLLTALSSDLRNLMNGIRRNSTLLVRQTGVQAVSRGSGSRQWLMCETAGSGGTPKIIRRSPVSWTRSFALTCREFGIGSNAVYATFGPLGHSLTLYAVMEAMSLGASLCGLCRMSPRRQALALRDFQATVLYATPTQMRLLQKGANAAGLDHFRHIEFVFCGGGRLDRDLRDALSKRFPLARIFEFYGASETSFITMSDGDCAGMPYPGVRIGIGDALNRTAFEVGEIWIRSPYLFDGYESGGSADTRWNGDALSIGEIGYLDATGRLYLSGRKKRMITVADHNVSLDSIETAITSLQGVETCVAIAKPDRIRGQIPICIIQPELSSMDKEKVIKHCHALIGPRAAPREVHFISEMPLLETGKPDLRALAGRYGGDC